ncbi:cytochrome c-type biogenesis protein [Oryzibacter oryziterrae]|uniref:cytochrome c-type biogenesis protein n=1 Tax=Oryzibacter oryziterrae TaxID=2766474 RepID=UPI001F316DEB|nr:cytochrome c-type biogenesis protein [Oryzibacter oryziterrae]
MRKWIAIASLVLSLTPAFAVDPSERLADPALEDRARHLSEQLRCLVCQNQNIDSSDAQLAKDLRLLVRERIGHGDSDQQVLDFLVARYGDFVLLKPRFEGTGAVLWVLPPVLLLLGAAGALWAMRRRRQVAGAGDVALSETEKTALERLLKDGENVSRD